MTLLVNFIFSLFSLLIVYNAPENYSYSFCVFVSSVFLVHNLIYFILIKYRNLVCFEFFFMLSFGLTNFIYPVFYYTTNPTFSMFSFPFNVNVISKSTSIAYLAYSFFLLGISSFRGDDYYHNTEIQGKPFTLAESKVKLLFKFAILFFVLYAIFGGIEATRNVYSGDKDINDVGIYSYIGVFFSITCTLLAMFLFRTFSKKTILPYSIILLLFIIILLSTGSRNFAIGIVLILIFTYNEYIKKISAIKLISLIILGACILTFIVFARTASVVDGDWFEAANSNGEINSFFDLFSDLVINNRNLYVLVDFADSVTNTYFFGMISDLLSPIPGAFSYLISIMNVPKEVMTAGALPTFLEFGSGSAFGLGTNMVGEAYVSFGMIGVIVFFYFFGFVIKKTRRASEYNIYAFVIYYMFVSVLISYPRFPIFFVNRNIAWGLLLVYFINKQIVDKKVTDE